MARTVALLGNKLCADLHRVLCCDDRRRTSWRLERLGPRRSRDGGEHRPASTSLRHSDLPGYEQKRKNTHSERCNNRRLDDGSFKCHMACVQGVAIAQITYPCAKAILTLAQTVWQSRSRLLPILELS